MTEANLDLQPSWPSYQSHEQLCCLHSSARSVHNFRKKQSYTYLGTLGATSSVAELTGYVHNSRKSQLYTYLGSARYLVLPSSVTEWDEVYTQF